MSEDLYVLDTHALVMFLEDDPGLGREARRVMLLRGSRLTVPIYCFQEMKDEFAGMNQRKTIHVPSTPALRLALHARNIRVISRGPGVLHEEAQLKAQKVDIDRQDLPICATAIAVQKVLGVPVFIITRDGKIRRSKLVRTIW